MPTNVEVKASIQDLKAFLGNAKLLSGSDGTKLEQVDTFFNSTNGRLKLRIENSSGTGTLIYYERNDVSGPKESNYTCTIVQNPEDFKKTLTLALGIKGTVHKVRQLFIIGQTRIHVDSVQNLGNFMELEVCMRKGQCLSEGQRIAQDLMEKLGVKEKDLIVGAYIDLLMNKQ